MKRQENETTHPDYTTARRLLAAALLSYPITQGERDKADYRRDVVDSIRPFVSGLALDAYALFYELDDHPRILQKIPPKEFIKLHMPTPGEQLAKRLRKTFKSNKLDHVIRYEQQRDLKPKTKPPLSAYKELASALSHLPKKQTSQPQRVALIDSCLYVRRNDPEGFAKRVSDAAVTDSLAPAKTTQRDRLNHAGNLFRWLEGAHQQDLALARKNHRSSRRVSEIEPPKYSLLLENVLTRPDLDLAGNAIYSFLSTNAKASISELCTLPQLEGRGFSRDSMSAIIQCFVETGFLRVTKKGDVCLTSDGKSANNLSADEIITSRIVWKIQRDSLTRKQPSTTLAGLNEIQSRWQADTNPPHLSTVDISADKPPLLINLKDLLLGYDGTDTKFISEILENLLAQPTSSRPSIAIISGLIFGEYAHSKSDIRARKVKSLDQYSAAKLVIDKLKAAGVKVIVNESEEDAWAARDMTLQMLFLLKNFNPEDETAHISYWKQNQLMTKDGDKYDSLLFGFCSRVAIPYFIRIGRSPMDSQEVSQATEGRIHIPELFILYDAWDCITHGKPIPPEYAKFIKPDFISSPNEHPNGLRFTHGLKLNVHTPDGDFKIWDIHSFALTGVPLIFSTAEKAEAMVKNLIGTGQETPDLVTIGHDGKFVLIRANNTWVASDPAPQNTGSPAENYTRLAMSRDRTKRRLAAGEYNTPANVRYQLHPDHSLTVQIDTRQFRALTDALPERVTLLLNGDEQTGSQTADLAAMAKIMYLATHVLPREGKTALNNMGDNTQGARLYKTFAAESGVSTRLVRPDQQGLLYATIAERATAEIPPGLLDNILWCHRIVGNHQWLDDPLAPAWNSYLANAYLAHNLGHTWEEGMKKVLVAQTLKTKTEGIIPLMDAAYEAVGPFGLWLTHRFVEKAQKAGGKGKHPIFMAFPFEQGLSPELAAVNFVFMGDMHIPGLFEINGRIYCIVPPTAHSSPYEWRRALSGAEPGAVKLQLGGNQLPTLTFLSNRFIQGIKIDSGPLSPERLADEHGLVTDKDYDPLTHHLYDSSAPKNALQKFILKTTEKIVAGADTELPHTPLIPRPPR